MRGIAKQLALIIVHPLLVAGILLIELITLPVFVFVFVISLPIAIEEYRLGNKIRQRKKKSDGFTFTKYEKFIMACSYPPIKILGIIDNISELYNKLTYIY